MDAVQAANSGHPGAPMGMADIAEVLWSDYLRHNPANPQWADRDRFVLSNGHASMLLYSLLHLTGYEDFTIDQLRNFRQLGFKTAGHPEYEPGGPVETTTGPLGQGITNAVGMAMAEKMLAAEFNRPGHEIVDHKTWVFLGDGCLMEGISHEACSLAGTLKLGKLICLYDDNNISIDGEVGGWFTDDTAKRFEAYGWQVIDNVDGHDAAAIAAAIEQATAETEQTDTDLLQDRSSVSVLRTSRARRRRMVRRWAKTRSPQRARSWVGIAAPFEIPADIAAAWDGRERGAGDGAALERGFCRLQRRIPRTRRRVRAPHGWQTAAGLVPACRQVRSPRSMPKAPRWPRARRRCVALNAFAPFLPEMAGGSADLTGSNLTKHAASTPISGDDANGNYVWFGVREFGMTAICNGLRCTVVSFRTRAPS